MVADALSRKRHYNAMTARELQPELCKEFECLNLCMVNNAEAVVMEVDFALEKEIRKRQLEDEKIKEIKQLIRDNKTSDFSEDNQGTLWMGKWICVPDIKHIRDLILREAHDSAYSIHPGSTKMYLDLKTRYWWHGMKRDVVEYVALCDTCQRVKTEH